MELDARQTSHVLGGLQPGTDYVVTVAPLFGQLEGPAASVRQRTGTGWARPLLVGLLASSRGRDEGSGWHSPTGSVCRGGRGADAADQHPGPHGHPGALGRPPRGPRLPPGVEESHRLGSGRPVPDVTPGVAAHGDAALLPAGPEPPRMVSLPSSVSSYQLTGLQPGTEYRITLYTLYDGGEVATPVTTFQTGE